MLTNYLKPQSVGLSVETGACFLGNGLLHNSLQCCPCEFGGRCPPARTGTVTQSPRSPQPASLDPAIATAVHFGASRAILGVSALAVIMWCQRRRLLPLLRTLRRRALIAEAKLRVLECSVPVRPLQIHSPAPAESANSLSLRSRLFLQSFHSFCEISFFFLGSSCSNYFPGNESQ